MKKIILSAVAVIIKTLSTIILGLLFTHDFETYTRYVSRTNDLSFGFLLYVFSVDVITILIIANITDAFFKDVRDRVEWTIHQKIRSYIVYSLIAVAIFCLTDIVFIIQIKSDKITHHLFTTLLLTEKYIVFLLISLTYILQIHKIQAADKARLFMNYQTFKFKNIMSEKLFLFSKIFYNTGAALSAYTMLIFYINIVILFLYYNTLFFFLKIIICALILFYLLVISVHQLNVIFSIYRDYTMKQQDAPPSVAMPSHKASK